VILRSILISTLVSLFFSGTYALAEATQIGETHFHKGKALTKEELEKVKVNTGKMDAKKAMLEEEKNEEKKKKDKDEEGGENQRDDPRYHVRTNLIAPVFERLEFGFDYTLQSWLTVGGTLAYHSLKTDANSAKGFGIGARAQIFFSELYKKWYLAPKMSFTSAKGALGSDPDVQQNFFSVGAFAGHSWNFFGFHLQVGAGLTYRSVDRSVANPILPEVELNVGYVF